MNTTIRLGAALSLIGLVACSDDLVGDWRGDSLSIAILEQEDGKYPFTGSLTVIARECSIDGDLVVRSDDSYDYSYSSTVCGLTGEGECILDGEGLNLTCTPDNAPKFVLQKLEQ